MYIIYALFTYYMFTSSRNTNTEHQSVLNVPQNIKNYIMNDIIINLCLIARDTGGNHIPP